MPCGPAGVPSVPGVSRRARPSPPAAARVRQLLARPPVRGWVPPPEDGDGAGGAQPLLASPPFPPPSPSPSPSPSWAAQDGRGEDLSYDRATGTADEPDGDGVDGSGADGSGGDRSGGDGSGTDEVDRPPGAPRPSAGRRLAASLPGSLPVALRTGRLDPGSRGALALVVVALLAAVVAGGVVLRGRPQEVLVPQVLSSGSPMPGVSAEPDPEAVVVVSVAGEVRRPGLVRLPAGSRVDDAVTAAGGPVEGASTGLLNLARRLVDGEQVLVGVEPPPGQPAGAGSGGGASAGGLLDLNTASASDLDALPGIGPVLAQRIVDWRTENDRFGSVDQLREVTGIGEAKFEDLRAKVTV